MTRTSAENDTTRGGLAVLGDVIVAPRAAFATLRERTHWGWAFVAISALGLIGGFLQVPAAEHLARAALPNDPGFATLTPEQQRSTLQFALTAQRYAWLSFPFVVAVAILIAALVLRLGSALGGGGATFARLFGVAANVAVINFGLGYFVTGLLAALRGAGNFNTTRDLLTVMPSLAWLVPGAAPKVAAFLAAINPLQIWSFFLLALGERIVGGVSHRTAYLVAAVVTVGGALLPALAAR